MEETDAGTLTRKRPGSTRIGKTETFTDTGEALGGGETALPEGGSGCLPDLRFFGGSSLRRFDLSCIPKVSRGGPLNMSIPA